MLGAHAQAALSMLSEAAVAGEGAAERVSETDEVTRVDRSFADIYGKPVLGAARRGAAQDHRARTRRRGLCLRLPGGRRRAVLLALLVVLNRVVLEPLARVTQSRRGGRRGLGSWRRG